MLKMLPERPILQQDLIANAAAGYGTLKKRGFTFGRCNDVDDVPRDLWNGPTALYQFPAAAQQMEVVSTSANDAAAGTGARQVFIHYLDNNYAIQSEIVTLNGLTPVLTAALNILRINEVHAWAVGSGRSAAGNISVRAVGGATTYALIEAGSNNAHQAVYTIPAGYWGYASHWQVSSGSSGNHFCWIELLADCHLGVRVPGVMLTQDEQGTQNGGLIITFPTPIPIPEKTDVVLRATSDGGAANVRAMGAILGWFEPM